MNHIYGDEQEAEWQRRLDEEKKIAAKEFFYQSADHWLDEASQWVSYSPDDNPEDEVLSGEPVDEIPTEESDSKPQPESQPDLEDTQPSRRFSGSTPHTPPAWHLSFRHQMWVVLAFLIIFLCGLEALYLYLS